MAVGYVIGHCVPVRTLPTFPKTVHLLQNLNKTGSLRVGKYFAAQRSIRDCQSEQIKGCQVSYCRLAVFSNSWLSPPPAVLHAAVEVDPLPTSML
jgi:hypothetical protein